MKPRSPEEARALIDAPRTTKPRKPRTHPEQDVGMQIDGFMAGRGFHICRFSRTIKTAGIFVSAVTTGVPDRYYWHPDGRSIWAELKAPGGQLRAAQREFLEGHRHNPIEAVCWSDVAQAKEWDHAFAP